MSYIGSTPTTQNFIAGTDSFNGTGSATNFTLSRSVNSTNDIQVVVNNVVQYPPNYSVSGNTLTISPAPSAGTNNVYVRYLSTTLQSITVPGGSTVVGGFNVTGNVGIGTSLPVSKLNIVDASATVNVRLESGSVIGQYFASSSGGGVFLDTASSHPLVFRTNSTERMRVDTSGNVGIGTTSPGTKLNVETAGADVEIRATTTTSGDVRVGFDASGAFYNWIQTDRSSGAMRFAVANTEQARITTAGLFQFNSGYGSVATVYGCRAWVNFNGTGVVAIRASGNVSSITDNGTGDYTVNFTTAMPDANYSAVTDGQIVVGATDITTQIAAAGFSTGSFRMNSQSNSANTLTDSPLITAAIFR